MERVNIKTFRGLNLIGDLYTADSDKIIIMSHGFNYDRHEKNNKFDKIATSLNKAGYNILTYDFSGSGESDDSPLTISNYTDDLKSVIEFVKNKGLKEIVLFGASLGGLISFLSYDKYIRAIICLAPPTDKAASDWRNRNFSIEELREFIRNGQISYKSKGLRDRIIIDKQYLLDREEINQKGLLKNIICPVLIFHADNDSYVPLEVSKNAVKIIGDNAELYIIKGAGHAFLENIDVVADKTINWLGNKL